MKKVMFKTLPVVCVALGASLAASAQESAKKAATESKAALTPFASVETRYSLMETMNKGQRYFFDQIARVGVELSYGKVVGKFEAGYLGNSKNTQNGPTSSATEAATAGNVVGQGVAVRQAYLGYNFMDSKNATFGVDIGRFYPHAATSYGNDALTDYWSAVEAINAVDGLAVNYKGSFDRFNVMAQVVMANSLPLYTFGVTGSSSTTYSWTGTGGSSSSNNGTGDSSFGGGSTSKDHSYVAHVGGSYELNKDMGVEAAFTYGMKKKASTGILAGANKTARDEAHMEASVGYNFKSLKAGAWFAQSTLKAVKVDTASDLSYSTDATGSVQTKYTVFGVGAQGDSSLFGKSSIFTKGDAFTFGGGYQRHAVKGDETTAVSGANVATVSTGAGSKDNDVSMYTLGAGYQAGPFATSLNFAMFNAKNKVFAKKGVSSDSKKATTVYLAATLRI